MANQFLALLRGINVGGKNLISKEDLKSCFEDLGLTNVRTYIQSGNLLFDSSTKAVGKLTQLVESELKHRFEYPAAAVIIPRANYRKAVANAPRNWGFDEDFKHNALFLLNGTNSQSLLKKLPPPKADIEQVTAEPGVIFWSISKEFQTRTSAMRLASSPEYKKVTVRNHNTVFRLMKMLEES